MGGHEIRVNHRPVRDGPHFIQRLARRITPDGAYVDSLVETRVDQTRWCLDGITHETILAALPRLRDHAFVVADDVLVELCASAVEERVVVSR